jgi:hypothetical protein
MPYTLPADVDKRGVRGLATYTPSLREIDRRPRDESCVLQAVGRQQYLLRKAVHRNTLSISLLR